MLKNKEQAIGLADRPISGQAGDRRRSALSELETLPADRGASRHSAEDQEPLTQAPTTAWAGIPEQYSTAAVTMPQTTWINLERMAELPFVQSRTLRN